jgi:hypothetical protein
MPLIVVPNLAGINSISWLLVTSLGLFRSEGRKSKMSCAFPTKLQNKARMQSHFKFNICVKYCINCMCCVQRRAFGNNLKNVWGSTVLHESGKEEEERGEGALTT